MQVLGGGRDARRREFSYFEARDGFGLPRRGGKSLKKKKGLSELSCTGVEEQRPSSPQKKDYERGQIRRDPLWHRRRTVAGQ